MQGVRRQRTPRGGSGVPATVEIPAAPRSTVGRGTSLPSGRAALGALLVTAAAVGLYGASTHAAQRPTTSYLVATRDLTPGHTMGPDDVRLQPLELAAVVAGRAFVQTSEVEGATLLGPVSAGELLQAGSLIKTGGERIGLELSVPIDPARAVGGTLRPGERVDLLATFGSGDSSTHEVVLQRALVVESLRAGGSLSSSGTLTLILSVEGREQALAATRALNTGEMLVVRSGPDETVQMPTTVPRPPIGTGPRPKATLG